MLSSVAMYQMIRAFRVLVLLGFLGPVAVADSHLTATEQEIVQFVDGSRLSLESAHRGVIIDCHNQSITETLGFLKIRNMSGMQYIETAVGHDDAFTAVARFGNRKIEFIQSNHSTTALATLV